VLTRQFKTMTAIPKCNVVAYTTSRLHSFSKILAVNFQLFRSPGVSTAMPFFIINRMLTGNEKNIAYAQERAKWEMNKAMSIVSKTKVPRWANVHRSSVIYPWKDESTLKRA
jgi:hypothetical protein